MIGSGTKAKPEVKKVLQMAAVAAKKVRVKITMTFAHDDTIATRRVG